MANDVSVSALTTYTYDALGQLLTETVNGEVVNTMTYDAYGNILTKNGVSYEYDSVWKDRLKQVGTELTVEYDDQGNPINYLGHTLNWEKGRQLKSFDNNTYAYNANGIRTSKTVNGIKHSFALDGSKILREEWCGNTLIPLYDNADSVCGIMYNGQHYFFLKNLQGDVIAITDSNGDTVARYSYDAWGACTVTQDSSNRSIATVNPYRYRGYYFDSETELYYLQSRYYDPSVGRFINADSPDYAAITGGNLYAYCGNCPTKNADYAGFCYTPVTSEETSKKTYSGIVGFGLQIMLYANLLCYQGFVGVEALWFAFTKNNNFGNGIMPWLYFFAGGSMGLTLDFEKLLSPNFLNNPKNVLSGFGLSFSISVSIAFFVIHANKMTGPESYLRDFQFYTNTILGVTTSKAWSTTITTYGVGFSIDVSAGIKGISAGAQLFGGTSGASYYYSLPLNPNASELYSLVESKV